jgi:pyruvate,water dikinase
MSQLFEATALVVPFEKLRMTDVESVGGKNASLGEMISQLPQGVRVPAALPPRLMPSASSWPEGLAGKISPRWPLWTSTTSAPWPLGAEIRAMVETSLSSRSGAGHP